MEWRLFLLYLRTTLAIVAFVIATPTMASDARTFYRTVAVDGVRIFYREAGDANAPAVLLLHGFPTSSHMYRALIPLLADRYHVVAPDMPGFGFSDAPDRARFRYSFEHLSEVMTRFTEIVGLDRYAVYVFDYGAPIGFRMALAHPERIAVIVSQNGNVYDEGLPSTFMRLKRAYVEPTEANRNELRAALTPTANQRRYFTGVPDADKPLIAPESFGLDDALMARPGIADIQLDLLADYWSNVEQYPKYQEYLRTRKPPLLAIWGKNDPTFMAAGAEAFKRDLPQAEVRLLDAGHFALETHVNEIAETLRAFFGQYLEEK